MGDILATLRQELDDAGMRDKEISFTARYNYFFTSQNRPQNGWVHDD